MLRYLVAFGKVGVEIVLAGEITPPGDVGPTGKSHPDGMFQCFPVQIRKGTGVCQRQRAHLRVRIGAETRGVSAEQLTGGPELGMYLQPDDDLVSGMHR